MKNLKNILKTLIVCIILFVALDKCYNILETKTSKKKYADFYEDNTELDVLLCGSSHMMNTILPMELYESYGITSYNIANSAEAIPTTYWVLKNALDYRKPKVVVLEVFYDGWGSKVQENNKSFLHNFFDTLPFSINKVRALSDLLNNSELLEYLYNFSIYHSRWNDITKDDFVIDYSTEKGAVLLTDYQKIDYDNTDFSASVDVRNLSKEYVYKIKELCDEHGIQLVLIEAPFAAKPDEIMTANGYQKLSQELGVDFINLLGSDIINYSTDMADRGHVNIRGAKKVTEYLGDYLKQKYGDIISFDYNDTWDKDLKEYKKYKEELLVNADNVEEVLILASISNDYYLDIAIVNNSFKSKYESLFYIISSDKLNIKVDNNLNSSLNVSIFDSNNKQLIKVIEFDKDGKKTTQN